MPHLSKAIKTEVIDGKVYFDLEETLEIMFNTVNASYVMATETNDTALGIAAAGMARMCEALEAVLTVQKKAHGLDGPPVRCGYAVPHPSHKFMVNRAIIQCEGLPT